MKKMLFILAALITAFVVTPAQARVELYLATSPDYAFNPLMQDGQPTDHIIVQQSETFPLYWGIWVADDQAPASIGGLDVQISLNAQLEVPANEPPVKLDAYDPPFTWADFPPIINQWDPAGFIILKTSRAPGSFIELGPGEHIFGEIWFHCENLGIDEKLPAGKYAAREGFTAFDSYHGVIVEQVPEPSTLLMLGTGVLGLLGTLRRRTR